MADDRKRKPASDDRSATAGSKSGDDKGPDKTLTEKAEEQAGGKNKNTPGKLYDV